MVAVSRPRSAQITAVPTGMVDIGLPAGPSLLLVLCGCHRQCASDGRSIEVRIVLLDTRLEVGQCARLIDAGLIVLGRDCSLPASVGVSYV